MLVKIEHHQLDSGEIPAALLNGGITILDLSGCTSLTKLPDNLPVKLTELDLSGCTNLTELPDNLPVELTKLYLSGCTNLTKLPDNLPVKLTELDLSGCTSLTKLPDNLLVKLVELTWLNLSGCRSLTKLPDNLPVKLTKLDLSGCTSLTELPDNLPVELVELTWLNLSDCTSLTKLPDNLPVGLTGLYLSDCTSLTKLPDNLPVGLTGLYLSGCNSLTKLPDNLPVELTKLYLSGCTNLTKLPDNLPVGLTGLYLSGCTSLTKLPDNLPVGLTGLDLSDCSSLLFTQDLANRLKGLKDRGCVVNLPANFRAASPSDLIKKRLDLVITKYHSSQSDDGTKDSPKIKELFDRFLKDGIGQRGGIKEVVESTSPILQFLEANPGYIELAEEIAKASLAGCVNQPVAGMSELAAWVSIASAENIIDKVEAAKQLMVLDKIKELVFQNGPGSGVEVEAGNALYREVHKKLLEKGVISKPWIGVPGPISYERSLDGWLTKKRIEEAFYEAVTLMGNPNAVSANNLCETHYFSTWEKIVATESAEVRDVISQYAKRMNDVILAITFSDFFDQIKQKRSEGKNDEVILNQFYESLEPVDNGREEAKEEVKEDAATEQEKEESKKNFRQLLSIISESKTIYEDVENSASFLSKRDAAVAAKVKEITFAALAKEPENSPKPGETEQVAATAGRGLGD